MDNFLDTYRLESEHRNEVIDKYLVQFAIEMKRLVVKYGENGYSAMSSFLAPVLDDFETFQQEWEEEIKLASLSACTNS